MTRQAEASPVLDAAACNVCGDCAKGCPVHAIHYVAPHKPVPAAIAAPATEGEPL